MKLTLAILFFCFCTPSYGLFYFSLQGETGIGGMDKFKEVFNGQELEHDAWTANIAVAGRAGLSMGPLFFGGTASYGKLQFEGERQDAFVQNGFDGAEDYDNVIERNMVGGFFGLRTFSRLHFLGEYYTEVNGRASYAEPRGENILEHGDRLKGKGWAIGVGGVFDRASVDFLYRRITYDRLILDEVRVDLPSSTIKDKIHTWEIVMQLGVSVDFLSKIK